MVKLIGVLLWLQPVHSTRASRAAGEALKVAILHLSYGFLLLSPMLSSNPEGPVTGKEKGYVSAASGLGLIKTPATARFDFQILARERATQSKE